MPPVLARGLASVLAALLLGALLLGAPVARAGSVAHGTAGFDRTLHGDVLVTGNTVTVCPPGNAARTCRAAERGEESGRPVDARRIWTDNDSDPTTFNSSTARLALPRGSEVVYAWLSWAGDNGAGGLVRRRFDDAGRGEQCGKLAQPPGSAETQAVRLGVGRERLLVRPERYQGTSSRPTWYSAGNDVTRAFAGVQGPVGVSVADVWTGEGRDCFGGWGLTVVWEEASAPVRRVVVRDVPGLAPPERSFEIAPDGLEVAEGPTRIGVTAYAGDAGADSFAVNGRPQADPRHPGRTENFFVANADGARMPDHVDNLSVDAKTITVGADVVRPGDGSIRIDVAGDGDAVLLRTLALSFPQAPPAPAAAPPAPRPQAPPPAPEPAPEPPPAPALPPAPEPPPPPQIPAPEPPTPAPAPAPPQAQPVPQPEPPPASTPRQIPLPGARPAAPAAPPVRTPAAVPEVRAVQVAPPVEAAPAQTTAPAAEATPEPAPPPAPRVAPDVPATRAPAPPPRVLAQPARSGPLASPARTAAVIGVLGVFVMTVSVGAFTAALRPR